MLTFIRPVLYLAGMMQLIVAGMMLIPCLLETLSRGPDAQAFFDSAVITGFISLSLILAMKSDIRSLNVKQMFLLVTTTWIITCVTCALPFMTTIAQMSFTDAFFEATSGITTTGSTVMTGLNDMPGGILLWRSLLQWVGGIGIVGIAIVLFPFMRIGGMQLFKSESSEKGEKVIAQAKIFAASLIGVYLLISITSAVIFRLAGMDWFDAINHMMTGVSTGGLSTKDSSIGYYNSIPIIWAAVFTMIMGALPFTWYMKLTVDFNSALGDRQVKAVLSCMLLSVLVMTAWVASYMDMPISWALSHAALNVVSIMTTTGFVSDDYTTWGGFAVMAFFCLCFIGGSTGSTTGSIKLFRWQIFFSSVRQQLLKMMLPHRVIPVRFNSKCVSDEVKDAVANFIILFFLSWLIISLALAMTGLDFVTALTGSLSSLSNVGPGFGDIIGPAGSFAPLNDVAKWICAFAMILGRLEILAVIMVFTRSFWRD